MKKLKIFKSRLDLNSFLLDAPSILIGRSSVCDQVLVAEGIKNIHFLLEWMGEGEFDSESGDWVIYDISDRKLSNVPSESMDGTVLGSDPILIGGVYFQIFNDRMQSTNISGLRFSQSVLQQVVDDVQATVNTRPVETGLPLHSVSSASSSLSSLGSAKVIELVRIKCEDDSVVNVSHVFNKTSAPQRNRFFPEFQIAWKLDQKLDLHFLNAPLEIVNLKSKSQVQSSKMTITNNEIIKAVYDKTYIIIRFVKEQPFVKTNRFKSEDSFVFIFMGILLLSLAFFLFISPSRPLVPKMINTTEIPRTVQIHEYEVSLPVATTIPAPPAPVIQQMSKELTTDTTIQKPDYPVPSTLPVIKQDMAQNNKKTDEKESNKKIDLIKKQTPQASAAVAVAHKMQTPLTDKKSTGLNTPAPINDINQVGLLAKLKNKDSSKNKISANDINTGFQDDVGPSHQGGIKIKSPAMGLLDTNLKKSEIKDSDLNQAKTTLSGAENFQSDNVGPIANADGLRGNLSLGTGLSSKKSLQAGGALNPGFSLNGAKGVSVQGGLTKAQVQEAIALHRREIRTCFESALMIKNNLQGTVMYEWDIRADGAVDIISTKSSDLKSAVVETCVQQIIKDIRFPKSKNGQPTKVFYPFLFQKT